MPMPEKRSRNEEIFERVHNGESASDLAEEFGISASRVGQIYRKKWKEHCDMSVYESVRKSIGKNRLIQTGPDQYKGECHLPNGKVKVKRFDMERQDAEEHWEAWVEQTEYDWEERHQASEEDAPTPPAPTVPETTWEGPAVATRDAEAIVVSVERPSDRPSDLYLLHRVDWQGVPMLFRSLDKALSTAESLGRVAGVEFDVTEVVFWDGED